MKRAGLVILFPFLISLGCSNEQFRLQSEDGDKDKQPEIKTVGTVTSVFGATPIRVMGYGVVRGLQGNGSDPMPSELRRQVMHDLRARGVEDPAAFLSTRDTAIVVVSAIVEPGLRAGDHIDVEVELPQDEKATSLRGGYLLECDLFEFTEASLLRENGRGSLKGKRVAVAEGPIITGLGDETDKERLRRGRVWNGGKSLIDRNFMLLINKENQDARTARIVAERINERFYGPFRNSVRGMAEAKTKGVVTLKIPAHYKHNYRRYLRVVRHIPLRESPATLAHYQKKLAEELLDPATTVTAALKLEALSTSPDQVTEELKNGLQSRDSLVRFCAAEALAYLGHPACGEPLAEVILEDPRLRAYGLTALASLDEAICVVKLRELMGAPSAETKYGAFRALLTLNPKEPAVQGEYLNESFYLHRVAPSTTGLVHISTSRRAEIVLFGEEPRLLPPFGHQAGVEFLVTAAEGDEHCIVARFSARTKEPIKESCSLRVDDVVRKLGQMGATYPDVVEFLLRSSKYRNLNCKLAVDALPQAPAVYEIAAEGVRRKNQKKTDDDDEDEGAELGGTPNLFAVPGRKPGKNP
jgi:hypothetical protein